MAQILTVLAATKTPNLLASRLPRSGMKLVLGSQQKELTTSEVFLFDESKNRKLARLLID